MPENRDDIVQFLGWALDQPNTWVVTYQQLIAYLGAPGTPIEDGELAGRWGRGGKVGVAWDIYLLLPGCMWAAVASFPCSPTNTPPSFAPCSDGRVYLRHELMS